MFVLCLLKIFLTSMLGFAEVSRSLEKQLVEVDSLDQWQTYENQKKSYEVLKVKCDYMLRRYSNPIACFEMFEMGKSELSLIFGQLNLAKVNKRCLEANYHQLNEKFFHTEIPDSPYMDKTCQNHLSEQKRIGLYIRTKE